MSTEKKIDIDLILTGFSEKQSKKVVEAAKILKVVINSLEFRNRVRSFHWYKNGIRQDRFLDCDLNRVLALKAFVEGVDLFNRTRDNDLDVWLTLYHTDTATVGYTYKSTWRTWLNNRFLSLWWNTPEKIAGNIAHEACHNIEGINRHSKRWTKYRRFSAPYAIGYLVAELGKKVDKASLSTVSVGKVKGRHYMCRPRFKWFPWLWKRCRWETYDL
jgi:hypothetical protein